ncbi:hypothetical protein KUCAC02_009338 [Chaenocephalus aceratus]|uniref:Uncharacterized protein n=1 Tax=Chaenocephalus aceratus TaxID=36190 RepID=A0ACB9WT19_CHAAC|nr:hypothetical protein KUCAC02_009338 [Chaenocephalus aceratus]
MTKCLLIIPMCGEKKIKAMHHYNNIYC